MQSWEDLQDPLEKSLLQCEKYQLITAADEERASIHSILCFIFISNWSLFLYLIGQQDQEERDRVRAENVMLEELAKGLSTLFSL